MSTVASSARTVEDSGGAPGLAAPRRLDLAWRLSLLVALAYLALCLAGALQTGTSWDELEHRKYGEMTLDFYRTLGGDRAATTYWTNYYGALHALVGACAERLFPSLPWPSARHLGSVAFSLIGFLYTIRLARLLAGPWAGLVAALLLATTPRWTGDAMFNPIDMPTAGMHAAALFYLARLVAAPERARRRDWFALGLATGLTLAVRAIGILILPYGGLAIAAWVLTTSGSKLALVRQHGARIANGFLLAGATAAVVTFALWPRLAVEPWTALMDTLVRTGSYPWPGAVFFEGGFFHGHALPRSYLAMWFTITTPPAVLLGLALALVYRGEWLARERGALLRAGVVVLALLFPPIYATLEHAVIYDGIRHFLFVLPPLAVLAAVGWVAALRCAARWRRWSAATAAAVLLALSAEPAVWYARSHPLEYTYFNPLIGGLARASHSYDTDYWGVSLRSAADELVRTRRELMGPDGQLALLCNVPWHLIEPWLDDPSKYTVVPSDQVETPHQIRLLHYRTLSPGWDLDPPPTTKKILVEGQVPFWQTYLVPRFIPGSRKSG